MEEIKMLCPFCQNEIPEGETRCSRCSAFSEYGYFNEIDDLFEDDADSDFQDEAFDGYDD